MSVGTPLALLALLVVPTLLLFALLIGRRRARYAVAYTNLDLLAGLVKPRRRLRRYLPLVLLAAALACAATAVAEPKTRVSVPDQNATIVLLVDVSGSMRAQDVAPSRLAAAVAAMNTFLNLLPAQFKVGLIAFSDTPQPILPPTSDRNLVRQAVGYLQPEAGTAIGDGLAAAVRMVKTSLAASGYVRSPGKPVPGAVVLLSDGAQNHGVLEPAQAAEAARAAGIRVYPVSLGTPNGMVTIGFGAFANHIPVPPDPLTMNAIAKTTGGRAYTAETASSVVDIYRSLGSSVGRTSEEIQITSWFALASGLLLIGAVGVGALLSSRLP